MKKVVMMATVLLMAASCTKKESFDLRAEYMDMSAAFEQFVDSVSANSASQEEAAEAIMPKYEAFVNEVCALLSEHMGEAYSDSLFVDIFPWLEDEQKAALAAKVTDDMRCNPMVADVMDSYENEVRTSVGQPFVEICGLTADGQELKVSELVGKTDYVLVDFWASWCGPCRRLMPTLKELYAEFHPQGKLDILGLSVDADEAAWQKAIQDDELPWHHARETREAPYNPSDLYGVVGIPTTILIDKNGTIVARSAEEEELRAILAK